MTGSDGDLGRAITTLLGSRGVADRQDDACEAIVVGDHHWIEPESLAGIDVIINCYGLSSPAKAN